MAASESGAHNADVAWNTELTEPDDLETMKIAANNPQTHAGIVNRLTVLGRLTDFLTALSVIGWIVLCCALIDVARDVGLLGWSTQDQPSQYGQGTGNTDAPSGNAFSGNDRLGDPVVQANWYWLTLTLGVSIAVSSYSSFRRNRAVIGGAGLMSFLTTLQWFSLFIYMARRVHQQSDDQVAISHLYNAQNSQYAEVAGAGLIAVAEAIRTLVLFFRYMTYMMVTKLDHDRVHIPSSRRCPHRRPGRARLLQPQLRQQRMPAPLSPSTLSRTTPPPIRHHAHQPRHCRRSTSPAPSYDAADADLYVPSYNMGIFHGSSMRSSSFIVRACRCLTLLGLVGACRWCTRRRTSGIFVHLPGNNGPEVNNSNVS